jgi:Cft2 family RNA processing exonuclease
MPANATLQFLGAADTVTGSRYLVTTPSARVLVDCGLFQGYKVLRERNRAAFPVPPDSIDAVVVSHAHLDHTGYLPALVRDGFRVHRRPRTIGRSAHATSSAAQGRGRGRHRIDLRRPAAQR